MGRRVTVANRLVLAGAGLGLGLAGRTWLARRGMADLRGQVVLITGGSRGLGLLLAREFAREGCRLVICARDPDELERARADLAGQGAEVLAVPCDVADRAQVDRLVAEATGSFGQVDILVNNAGIIQVGPFETMTYQDFETALGVIFWGVVHPTLAVLPQMRARRSGRIVNVTSIGGKVSMPHLLPYNCAKFAATAFSEGLRAELAGDGISVTTIVPGLMRTGSPVNADFKGQAELEFAWFALSDSLPFLSMDAERAARAIVTATRRGEAERILTLPASLAVRVHGLAPGLTTDLLGVVDRLLPPADGGTTATVRGETARQRLNSPLVDGLIGWTRSAAARFRQYPGPQPEVSGQGTPAPSGPGLETVAGQRAAGPDGATVRPAPTGDGATPESDPVGPNGPPR